MLMRRRWTLNCSFKYLSAVAANAASHDDDDDENALSFRLCKSIVASFPRFVGSKLCFRCHDRKTFTKAIVNSLQCHRKTIRGCLHASESPYETPYDSVHDFYANIKGILLFFCHPLKWFVFTFLAKKSKNNLLDTFGSKSYTESYGDSYGKSHV
jgi:hypothetical protein